jgi:hypothetical protein
MAAPLQPFRFINKFGTTNEVRNGAAFAVTDGTDETLYADSPTSLAYDTSAGGAVDLILPLEGPSTGQVFTIGNAAGGSNIVVKQNAVDGAATITTIPTAKSAIVVNDATLGWQEFFLQTA